MESRFEKRVLYIQDNANHYLNKFSIMESSGNKISWNWCAFVFTSAWMFYRKMYKPAFVVAAIELLIIPFIVAVSVGPASMFSTMGTNIGGILSLAISVALGLFGNYIYMQHIDQLMDNEPLTDPFDYQQKYGGISWKLVVIYIIVSNVITAIVENIFD